MTIIGILFLIIGVLSLVFFNVIKERIESFSKKVSYVIIGAGVLFSLFTSFFYYAQPGYQYYIVSPFGDVSTQFSQGWKTKIPFSNIQEWASFYDIKVVSDGESSEDVEGVIPATKQDPGIPIRFIDQVTGHVKLSVRMQLPQTPEDFAKLAEEFKTQQNLVNNTLIPTVKEQVINTGYMFTGENYVSGDASNFRVTLDDQLKMGGYAVDKKLYKDTIYDNIQNLNEQRKITEVKTRYEVIKRKDGNGKAIRIIHDIAKNKITVSQVIVDQIVLEKKFREKLENQRDISAQKSIEIQKIETAKAAQQRILAEGERDKSQERVKQEREQVKVLIEIETRLKQEETNRQLAKIQLETQKFQALKQKAAADAQAYENAKLVKAGLTPLQKAEIDKETKIGVAEALSKTTWPTTYINGTSAKGGMLPDLIGADYASKMLNTTK